MNDLFKKWIASVRRIHSFPLADSPPRARHFVSFTSRVLASIFKQALYIKEIQGISTLRGQRLLSHRTPPKQELSNITPGYSLKLDVL